MYTHKTMCYEKYEKTMIQQRKARKEMVKREKKEVVVPTIS